MHIVFFVTRYWTAVGGVEKYIPELGKALVAMGHRVTVVAGAHKPGLAQHEMHEGINVIRFPAYRSRLRCWFHLVRHRRLFKEADVVHISDVLMVEYFQAMIGWTMPRRSIFLTRHGLSYKCPVPVEEQRRAARAAAWVDGIMDDGEFIAKWLNVPSDTALEQGLCPLADAIDQVPEPPADSAVFVGRLEWDTGIQIYIDTIDVLRRKHGLHITLDVYGGGSMEEELRARVKRNDLPVTFHGFVEGAQRHLVDGCFAFVSGRLAIQEAMARHRLVVAAYVNDLKRDYVTGEPFSPYLLSAGSAEGVADHVAHYARDTRGRAHMVECAFEHARTLTWKRTAQGYLKMWCAKRESIVTSSGWLERAILAMRLRAELK